MVFYSDFECPRCALADVRLSGAYARRVFRHFPVASKHPRAWAAACAAEAAGLQGSFWAFHDALFADQGRLEDPHLWRRAEHLGLDIERFEVDRHAEVTVARVRRDFDAGVRAGAMSTPAIFIDGRRLEGRLDELLRSGELPAR